MSTALALQSLSQPLLARENSTVNTIPFASENTNSTSVPFTIDFPSTASFTEIDGSRVLEGYFSINDPENELGKMLQQSEYGFTVTAKVFVPTEVSSLDTGSWEKEIHRHKYTMIASLGDNMMGMRFLTCEESYHPFMSEVWIKDEEWETPEYVIEDSSFLNNWHEVSLIYDRQSINIAIDGEIKNSLPANEIREESVQYPFSIGFDPSKPARTNELKFASVKVYSKALTNEDLFNLDQVKDCDTLLNLDFQNGIYKKNPNLDFTTKKNEPVFVPGYNFERDSFKFNNYTDEISVKYFTTLFEPAPGKDLFDYQTEDRKGGRKDVFISNGMCYGMATSTASIYNKLPDVKDFSLLFNKAEKISDINRLWSFKRKSDNASIFLKDMIRYNHISQFSRKSTAAKYAYRDVRYIYDLVKNYTDEGRLGVTIRLEHYNNNGKSSGAHRVLAVGYTDNSILIDDPNFYYDRSNDNMTKQLQKITFTPDGSWAFDNPWGDEPITDKNTKLSYYLNYLDGYNYILTGKTLTSFLQDTSSNDTSDLVISLNGEKLDADSSMLRIKTDQGSYSLPNATEIPLANDEATDAFDYANKNGRLFWINESDSFSIGSLTGNTELSFASDETSLKFKGNTIKGGSGTINTNIQEMTIDPNLNGPVNVSLMKVNEMGETVEIAVEGSPSSKITIRETSSGTKVEGISKGTVALYQNDEKIKETSFTDSNASFTVDFNKGGNDQNMSVKEVDSQAPAVPVVKAVSMHRLYNPNSGEHFYTAADNEKNHLVSVGWKYEGEGWKAPDKSNAPVYRLYNPNAGDHHYTLNVNEKDALVKLGWNYEGIGWYSDENKAVPLYREYNPNAKAGSHNYTPNKNEHNFLTSNGWKDEGIAWYGLK